MATTKNQLKTVIITGGSSGIGLDAARQLLETKDYRLVIIAKEPDGIEKAAKDLDSYKDRVTFFQCDISDTAKLRDVTEKILNSHPFIYGLVNCAGIYPFGGLSDTTESTWEHVMNINLKAAFLLTQKLSAAMVRGRQGGRIVNVSSTAGLLPNHFALAYSVSKAALIAFTKTIAKELGKDGITANCVCPGIVRTPMHDAYHKGDKELNQFYLKRGAAYPMGRVGEPSDVTASIKFFLSEEASWITGDVMIVDGGRLLI